MCTAVCPPQVHIKEFKERRRGGAKGGSESASADAAAGPAGSGGGGGEVKDFIKAAIMVEKESQVCVWG